MGPRRDLVSPPRYLSSLFRVVSVFAIVVLALYLILFVKFPGPSTAASIVTDPKPGSILSGPSVSFSWSGGSFINVLSGGSAPGAADWFYSRAAGLCPDLSFPDNHNINFDINSRSARVINLPTDGRIIYVRLWSIKADVGWCEASARECWYRDYKYRAGDSGKSDTAVETPESAYPLPGYELIGGFAHHSPVGRCLRPG